MCRMKTRRYREKRIPGPIPQVFTEEELLTERWAPVPVEEVAWKFSISTLGRVRRDVPGKSTRAGHILSWTRDSDGYAQVGLSVSASKSYTRQIHRLVIAAFLGARPPGHDIDHIDGDRENPRLSNLRYVTHARNIRLSMESTMKRTGRHYHCASLAPAQVTCIRLLVSAGAQQKRVARWFGSNKNVVNALVKGKTYHSSFIDGWAPDAATRACVG